MQELENFTRVARVIVEDGEHSIFVSQSAPRISWTTESSTSNWHQIKAELLLKCEGSTETVICDSADSVLVQWPFAPLVKGVLYSLSLRVTGQDGETSPWSPEITLVSAELDDADTPDTFIGTGTPGETDGTTLLRKVLDLKSGVAKATLFATAFGAYQVEINGREVDDHLLKPGWTAYQHRLAYEATDVTGLLQDGSNVVGIWLAGGWFTEGYGFSGQAAPYYGTNPSVALRLEIEYLDGSNEVISADESWRILENGPLTSSSIYHGENYDAQLYPRDWHTSEFNDSDWAQAAIVKSLTGQFSESSPSTGPRIGPPVRAIEEVSVQEVITSPSGATILDFGQNLVGTLKIRVCGPRGHTVTLKHAEVLEHDELGVRPLRMAKATDTYTLSGAGPEEWQPRFTFHGFRYAQVDNWPGTFNPADVTAVVIHSDMMRTGWFESSNPMVNQLHENVVWGMRGNFLSLPTDCPQRDERLGWTGDIQVFAPTAGFLYQCNGFLENWLTDLRLEQAQRNGVVPVVIPSSLPPMFETPAAAWGDAATVVPWTLRDVFGNEEILRAQYGSMKAWVDVVAEASGPDRLWEGMFQFGDWLDPSAPPEDAAAAKTSPDIVATGYFFKSCEILANVAALLGNTVDAEHYSILKEQIRDAFLSEYVTPNGRMVSDAQTAYALTINFGIEPDEGKRRVMGARLAALVEAADFRIGTGFVGTPIILDALTTTGHFQVATALLLQTKNPSWLYPITMGATTIWERWDSMLEDGTVNPGEMTSFNHYALGAVAEWLHRTLAGLAPKEPGYKRILINPHVSPQFDFARASHETPYGLASSAWTRTPNGIRFDVTIPPNTTAEIALSTASGTVPAEVGSGTYSWTLPEKELVALS